MMKYLDDLLLLAGCLCILRGFSMWSAMATWIAAGMMFIAFGVMVAKDMASHVIEKPADE